MVIFFVRFVDSWTHILAVFATRGNVKVGLLAKIMTETVIVAEQSRLFVDFITGDGATGKTEMRSLIGTRATTSFVKHKVRHIIDPTGSLYFVSDFPHLIKYLRNGLLKQSFNTPAGEAIATFLLVAIYNTNHFILHLLH